MDIVFVGTTRFGLRCLETLLGLPQCRIVGVVAARPTLRISYRPEGVRNVLHADMEAICEAKSLPLLLLSEGMAAPGALEQVAGWSPDAFVVAGWFHMIPKAWRELAPAYGLHASLLPDYSGGAPLVWAMINGEGRTGITLFQLADGVDNGPIVGQAETDISPEDDIASLYARIEDLGAGLLERYVPELAAGQARLESQDERLRRCFPQRGPEDGLIDWSMPADRIHNFIRAQTRPYPGAFSWLGDRKVTIWASRVATGNIHRLSPGHFACLEGRLLVGSGSVAIELVSLAVAGRETNAPDFCADTGGSGAFSASLEEAR
jgi:methionyl-tRNA formyltransferase